MDRDNIINYYLTRSVCGMASGRQRVDKQGVRWHTTIILSLTTVGTDQCKMGINTVRHGRGVSTLCLPDATPRHRSC